MSRTSGEVLSGVSSEVLGRAGFGNTQPKDYQPRQVTLRDGHRTQVWVHRQTGHGILDASCWQNANFYEQSYREEFGPELSEQTPP
jgi:hypothetical protein